jgi:small subunit ribosomal protein S20
MANKKSAIKEIKKNAKKNFINKSRKSDIKSEIKKIMSSLGSTSRDSLDKMMDVAKSKIMRAAHKGVLHKNTASRKISRLTQRIDS